MTRGTSSPFSSPLASGPNGASFSFWIGTPTHHFSDQSYAPACGQQKTGQIIVHKLETGAGVRRWLKHWQWKCGKHRDSDVDDPRRHGLLQHRLFSVAAGVFTQQPVLGPASHFTAHVTRHHTKAKQINAHLYSTNTQKHLFISSYHQGATQRWGHNLGPMCFPNLTKRLLYACMCLSH